MLNIIEGDLPEKSILITGCPGSGKTTVSIHRFIYLHNLGKRVQFLTYQNLLRLSIQNILGAQGIPTGNVSTLCKWYSSQTGGQFFYEGKNYHLPNATQIVERLGKLTTQPLDELLIDEGQDVHPKAFASLPNVSVKMTVGADDAQQVHEKGSTIAQIQTELTGFGGIRQCELQYNYRNSYETYNFARQFVPEIPTANDATTLSLLKEHRSGNTAELPRVFIYHDSQQLKDRLARLIENTEGRIAILLPKTEDVDAYSKLIASIAISGTPVPHTTYYNGMTVPFTLERILVTTFMSAKGMEFDAVIMPCLHSSSALAWRRQCYVGCTRAIRNLYVFCHSNLHPMLNGFDADTYQLQDLAGGR